ARQASGTCRMGRGRRDPAVAHRLRRQRRERPRRAGGGGVARRRPRRPPARDGRRARRARTPRRRGRGAGGRRARARGARRTDFTTRRDTRMSVTIGSRQVGGKAPAFVIAEIRLNHNGSVELAKQLIDVAADAGADAVKFQKRTPEIATPEHMRDTPRDTPWGTMTYLEYRHRVEFGRDEYVEIGDHAVLRGLEWFASPWDVPSVEFLE